MANIASAASYMNDLEVRFEAALSEQLFTKFGANVNYLLDSHTSQAASISTNTSNIASLTTRMGNREALAYRQDLISTTIAYASGYGDWFSMSSITCQGNSSANQVFRVYWNWDAVFRRTGDHNALSNHYGRYIAYYRVNGGSWTAFLSSGSNSFDRVKALFDEMDVTFEVAGGANDFTLDLRWEGDLEFTGGGSVADITLTAKPLVCCQLR